MTHTTSEINSLDGDVQGTVNGEPPLARYMRDVNSIPALSHNETMARFRTLDEKRVLLEELQRQQDGNFEQEQRRQSLERETARLKEELVTANLRLVVYFANRYQNLGVPLQDLVQEGNIGLMRAIDKFDYCRGFRFSTYAAWWIRQAVRKAVQQQGSLIRIPTRMQDKIRRQRGTSRHESSEGLVDAEGGDVDGMDNQMQEVHEIMREPLPLEAPLSEDGPQLQEVVSNENQSSPEDLFINENLKEKLPAALMDLPIRDDIILRLRYGINLPDSYTLAEVGELLQVTKERIRQIQSRAVKRLREGAVFG